MNHLENVVASRGRCSGCGRSLVPNSRWRTIPAEVRADYREFIAEKVRDSICKGCSRRTTQRKQHSADLIVALFEEHRRSWETLNATYRRVAEDLDCDWKTVAKAIQRQKKAGLL